MINPTQGREDSGLVIPEATQCRHNGCILASRALLPEVGGGSGRQLKKDGCSQCLEKPLAPAVPLPAAACATFWGLKPAWLPAGCWLIALMPVRAAAHHLLRGWSPSSIPLAVTPRAADAGWLASVMASTDRDDIILGWEPGTGGRGKGLAHLSSHVHLQFSLSISFQSGYSHVSY